MMEYSREENLLIVALSMAVEHHSKPECGRATDDVVSTAKKFYAFLTEEI